LTIRFGGTTMYLRRTFGLSHAPEVGRQALEPVTGTVAIGMIYDPHKLFAPRRIGVCGSSKDLPAEAVWFCESVGRRLATEAHVVIVSGGSRKRDDVAEGNLATDWHIVNAAAEAI
jgi:hypothetical protein